MTTANERLNLTNLRIYHLQSKDSVRRFSCGENEIDRWVTEKAAKWTQQNRTRVYIAVEDSGTVAKGFYSLSFAAEDSNKLVRRERDIWPNSFPFVYIGYLAVQSSCQNCGLGTLLLIDALKRSHLVSQHVAFYGVGLRSLNDRTTKLYEKFGFSMAPGEAKHPLMILPIWTLYDLIGSDQ